MKKILTAGVIALTFAGAAQAQNMFGLMETDLDGNTTTIALEPLQVEEDGFVAIYDHHTGEVGELLGVASVRAGANRQIRVQLGRPVNRDVIAFLFSGDDFNDPSAAVDSVEIDVN